MLQEKLELWSPPTHCLESPQPSQVRRSRLVHSEPLQLHFLPLRRQRDRTGQSRFVMEGSCHGSTAWHLLRKKGSIDGNSMQNSFSSKSMQDMLVSEQLLPNCGESAR